MDEPNSLTQELKAMAAIAQALDGLADPAARQRVLKWAAERLVAGGAQAPDFPARSTAALAVDAGLVVDSLNDLFVSVAADADDDLGEFDSRRIADAPEGASQPLEVVLRSFAADFQRFADEWNGATA